MNGFSLNSHYLGEIEKDLIFSEPRRLVPINLEEANEDPLWRTPPLIQMKTISAGKILKHRGSCSTK